ncbi:MAG: hypothetical protein ACSHXK_09395 [Oceanococcus sp.]
MLRSAHPIVVVCGLRNSSVSRIAAILANNPNALLLPELNLFLADKLSALQVMFQRSQDGSGDGLLRAIAALKFHAQDNAAIEQAKDWLWRRGDWTCHQLLQQLAQDCYPQQLIIPDLMLGWRPNYVSRLRAYGDIRLLHVVRHPVHHCRDLVAALTQEGFVAPEWKDFHLDPIGTIDPQIAWYRFHKHLFEFSERDDHCHILNLENVQASPQTSFSAVAEKLMWDVVPDHKLSSEFSFLRPGPESAPMGLEREVLMRPQLTLELRRDPPLRARADWREDSIRICDEVIALAQTLGY